MAGKIEILKDKHGDYQFQVRAKDGEIVAVGQSYPTKARAEQGVLDTLKGGLEGQGLRPHRHRAPLGPSHLIRPRSAQRVRVDSSIIRDSFSGFRTV